MLLRQCPLPQQFWCEPILFAEQKPRADLVFLLFIGNFECSDRGGDVIKPRHPLEAATTRKSPLLSCSTPQSLFLRGPIIFCVSPGHLIYPVLSLDVLSVFRSYLARDLNLGYFCGAAVAPWTLIIQPVRTCHINGH